MTEHLPEVDVALTTARPWRSTLVSFATLASGEGIARCFGLVTVLVLARELGPAGFGAITLGLVVVTWFSVIADAGTQTLSTRDVAREPGRFREIAEAVVGLRLALGLAGAAVLAVGAAAAARSETNRDVYVLFALVLPAAALNLRWITLAVRGARSVAVGNALGQLTVMVGALLLVNSHDDIRRVPLLYAAGEAVFAVAILALLIPRFGVLRPGLDTALWRETLREGSPLIVSSSARGVLLGFDLLVIGIVLGPAETGLFGAASRPVLFVITAIGLFFFSLVASLSPLQGTAARALIRASIRTNAGVSILVATGLAVASLPLVALLYGDRYDGAAVLLAILAWKIPLSAVTAPFTAVLLSAGRQRVVMWINVVAAVVGMALVLVAVHVGGTTAVAASGVAALGVVCVLTVRAARTTGLVPSFRELVR